MSKYHDQLPGGLADKKKPSDFNKNALVMGVEVEIEHTDDKMKALEIAMDHLTEDPDYYNKLKTIEKESYINEYSSLASMGGNTEGGDDNEDEELMYMLKNRPKFKMADIVDDEYIHLEGKTNMIKLSSLFLEAEKDKKTPSKSGNKAKPAVKKKAPTKSPAKTSNPAVKDKSRSISLIFYR